MSEWLVLFLLMLVVAGLAALLYWLLITTEGVYLGRRVVIWLYDLYAGRYDGIKHFRSDYDHLFLAQPIMDLIAPQRTPRVLDAATGTGRLPLALLHHGQFDGSILGVDLSRPMLAHAAAKTDDARVTWICAPAEKLPVYDGACDVVSCIEALEFMTDPGLVLGELARVLRPGGLLMITSRRTGRWMPGKAWDFERTGEALDDLGFEGIEGQSWQVDYDLVWAFKAGEATEASDPLLRCPACGGVLEREADRLRCARCGQCAPVADDGVIDLARGVQACDPLPAPLE
ncbi:MAG TPA: methyltransferase domain-containing protein [Candidatus Limnocylindrales bacterium]|nr:methyltransferase domain-containing protein [Candidatus Limnocylindrales bacterium]